MLRTILVIGFSVVMVNAANGIPCQERKGHDNNGYWHWRIIDGKKCWYTGRNQLPKSQLTWPVREQPPIAAPDLIPGDEIHPDELEPFDTFNDRWRGLLR